MVSYQYDPESRLYKRFINDSPHLDISNLVQLTAANVVVIEAEHTILDDEGRRDVGLVGGGKGICFRETKCNP